MYNYKDLCNAIGIDDITWETRPGDDELSGGWLDSGWNLADWKKWHQKLVEKYGDSEAANIWLSYWQKQDWDDATVAEGKLDSDFKDYLKQHNIDLNSGSILGTAETTVAGGFNKAKEVVGKAAGAGESLLDSASSLFGGAGSLFESAKWIIPVAIIIIIIIIAVVAYNMSKNSKISV